MGIWQSALILLGIGIVSERFGAGVGLGELGTGIRTLAAAPLGGLGVGFGEFGTGLRTFAESLGDIGRGFGELFKHIPQLPAPGPPGPGPQIVTPTNGNGLMTVSGGDDTTNWTGGGGNVTPGLPSVGFNGGGFIAPPYVPDPSPVDITPPSPVNLDGTSGTRPRIAVDIMLRPV